jgi:hypothetical protein
MRNKQLTVASVNSILQVLDQAVTGTDHTTVAGGVFLYTGKSLV